MKFLVFNIIIQLIVFITVYGQDVENKEFVAGSSYIFEGNCPSNLNRVRVESFDISPYDFSVNTITLAKYLYPQINGVGMRVSVKEELFDTTSIDLKSHIILTGQQSSTIYQHATSIATQIAGAGNSSRTGLGVAPAAILSSSSFYDLSPDDTSVFRDQNIYVQNHSYGTKIENYYGELAAAYDAQVVKLKELLHVFSSGNSGLLASEEGDYAGIVGYANLTGSFKMSKNTLSVGAIDAMEQVIDRSSKGPAYDGRVKPELVAYALNGTSDAAALVSGATLLIQQLYKEKAGEYPQSDLARAVLIAAASDVNSSAIDFATGYGSLDVAKSLGVINDGTYINASVTKGQTFRRSIVIPEGVSSIRLALSWIDPAAEADAETALVNDLDIKLIKPDGSIVLPWVLNIGADLQQLESDAVRGEDHLNNNELISLEDLAPGDYIIEVSGSQIESGEQSFAIAYSFMQSEKFNWEFPRETDALVEGDQYYMRWSSTLSQNTGELQININESGWQTIKNEVDLSLGYTLVDFTGISGVARLRMQNGDSYFETENFSVSVELKPKVEFNCDDAFLLSWPSVENATAYEVKVFNSGKMSRVDLVTDTTYVGDKVQFINSDYSITPYFGEKPGVQGVSIDYLQQGVSCYFISFFGFLDDSPAARLTLNLSTGIGVEEVVFRRSEGGEVVNLQQFEPPFKDLTIEIADEDLPGGEVFYDAVIILKTGEEITTNAVQFFLPFEDELFVYPNPLSRGDELKLISKGDDLKVRIVNIKGQQVYEEVLLRINDRLELPMESAGIYLIEVFREDKRIAVKKLVVY